MLLDIKPSKSKKTLVITDPGGDVHACTTAEELWEAVKEILADDSMPEREVLPGNGRAQPRSAEAPPAGGEDDDLVDELMGRALGGLLGGLRRASYRGKTGKKKPPPPQEEDSG